MSSGRADEPQEDEEQPPELAACFIASKSIGLRRLSSDIVKGWLIVARPVLRGPHRKQRASHILR
jgi:hypothetical protein